MSAHERWIVIPRWDEFQHRDMARSSVPPWIKNLTRLLGDTDYLRLSQSQRGILHGIWLLYASQRRVVSEADARRLLVGSEAEARYWRGNLEALNRAGYIYLSASRPARHVASKSASLEVEGEVEGQEGSSRSKSSTHQEARPGQNVYAAELERIAAQQALQNGSGTNGTRPPADEPYFEHLLAAVGNTEENFAKLRRASRGEPVGALVAALEAARAPGTRDPLAVALTILADYSKPVET